MLTRGRLKKDIVMIVELARWWGRSLRTHTHSVSDHKGARAERNTSAPDSRHTPISTLLSFCLFSESFLSKSFPDVRTLRSAIKASPTSDRTRISSSESTNRQNRLPFPCFSLFVSGRRSYANRMSFTRLPALVPLPTFTTGYLSIFSPYLCHWNYIIRKSSTR